MAREHADAVQADMQAVYHLDDSQLSWRKRATFLRHLPDDSATAAAVRDGPRWTLEAHLLDDVRMWLMAVAGVEAKNIKPHTQRPVARQTIDPARQKKLSDARRRARERKRLIEVGEID